MSTTNDTKVHNDALKMLLLALANPMVLQMEAIWKISDDRHEGARCMALYISQFAPRLGIANHDVALDDELTRLIEARWSG